MVVPIAWLKRYIELSESPQEVAQAFTSIGYMLDRPIDGDGDNAVLDLEVRQNRSDCLSIVGLARELGALLRKDITIPSAPAPENISGGTTISISEPHLCPRFFAVTLENVSITESPDWMKQLLEAYGIKPINNIVDITNFVSIELGMPMHAYDADKVVDRHITIRNAHEGESLVLFGGKNVSFDTDDIIHADTEGPIGFGALMGGEDKSVHDTTKSIILEAAVYDQASVRRSSRRHAIRTEASSRLEKFLHPELVEYAMNRALELLKETSDVTIVDVTDEYVQKVDSSDITMTYHQLHRLTGIDISADESHDILSRLGFNIVSSDDSSITVSVPYYRTDVEQEEDLIEEVIRIYGYDKIPENLPSSAVPADIQSDMFVLEEKIKDVLISLGYDEVITEPLVPSTETSDDTIILENSLTSEKAALRTSLEGSLKNALSEREKYREDTIYDMRGLKLFEVGKTYHIHDGSYTEHREVGAITTEINDPLYLKGDIEIVLERVGYAYNPDAVTLHQIGETSYFFAINLDTLVNNTMEYSAELLSSPPQVIMHDISIEISDTSALPSMMSAIRELDSRIFKVYIKDIADVQGTLKALMSIAYHDSENSLSEDDVAPLREKILSLLESSQ